MECLSSGASSKLSATPCVAWESMQEVTWMQRQLYKIASRAYKMVCHLWTGLWNWHSRVHVSFLKEQRSVRTPDGEFQKQGQGGGTKMKTGRKPIKHHVFFLIVLFSRVKDSGALPGHPMRTGRSAHPCHGSSWRWSGHKCLVVSIGLCRGRVCRSVLQGFLRRMRLCYHRLVLGFARLKTDNALD